MIEVTWGDVVRRLAPLVAAAFAACVAVGVSAGRQIDRAVRSIGDVSLDKAHLICQD